MSGPITAAATSPEMTRLFEEMVAHMPAGTTIYIVAVGPLDTETRMREVAVGGDLDDGLARRAAQAALAGRGEVTGEILLRERMN